LKEYHFHLTNIIHWRRDMWFK